MSLLEERIKRAAKNRPVIKKPMPEPEVPTVRGGGAAAAGRPNRVTPKAAQPAPQLLRERGAPRAGEQQATGLKRLVLGHTGELWEACRIEASVGLNRLYIMYIVSFKGLWELILFHFIFIFIYF